jgi:AcrR family transcriptional regulator
VKVALGTDRRAAIGDAAIAIVAREGLRALTHRAIDRELGLPAGSTSYYARTRRQLIEAIVHRLAARTLADLGRGEAPGSEPGGGTPGKEPGSGAPGKEPGGETDRERDVVGAAARELAGLVERMAARGDDHRVRWALEVDLAGDAELHAYLTHGSPVRAGFLAGAADRLREIGVGEPERYAPALVMLVDGLLFDRLAGSGVDPASRPDAESVLGAFLLGLVTSRRS